MELKEIEQTKEEITEFLNSNGLVHYQIIYHGCEGFFIPAGNSEGCRTYSGITVTKCNKDICRVYPHEILYIAIEDRKSVLYLTDRKIETNYHLNYWKSILKERCFAQPHYSYIVNLNYVNEITRDFVKIKSGNDEYKVYTSARKISAFKKSFIEFIG